jgi:glycerophosphoryl diester phosphodiesterase
VVVRTHRLVRLVLALIAVALVPACAGPQLRAAAGSPASSRAQSSTTPQSPTPQSPTPLSPTPLQAWLSHTPLYVAHRGGDADWTEGTAYAYGQAAAWNPRLALEAAVWRSSDGVWVISEERSTGRLFDADVDIPSTPWSVLSKLRTRVGHRPMARLREDLLDVYGRTRILFLDNKQDLHATEFLDLLSSYAGRTRYVVKSFWNSDVTAAAAHRRGYLTWGYYYAKDMAHVAATQRHFDLLGLEYSASDRDFRVLEATGKPVIAHVIEAPDQARTALDKGASGLMVAGVRSVVPVG